MEILEDVSNNKLYNHIEFSWVNATCQVDFAKHFNAEITNLPRLIAYLPKTNQYAIMYRAFENDNITEFVDSILNGKAPLIDYDTEKMYLRNAVNCFEVKEDQVDDTDFEDDEEIINDVIEESQKKYSGSENYYKNADLQKFR